MCNSEKPLMNFRFSAKVLVVAGGETVWQQSTRGKNECDRTREASIEKEHCLLTLQTYSTQLSKKFTFWRPQVT